MSSTRLKRCPHPDCHELIPLDATDCGKHQQLGKMCEQCGKNPVRSPKKGKLCEECIKANTKAGCERRESRKKVKRKEPQSASGKWKVAQREKDRLASLTVKPAETVTVQVNAEMLAQRMMRGAIVDRIY